MIGALTRRPRQFSIRASQPGSRYSPLAQQRTATALFSGRITSAGLPRTGVRVQVTRCRGNASGGTYLVPRSNGTYSAPIRGRTTSRSFYYSGSSAVRILC